MIPSCGGVAGAGMGAGFGTGADFGVGVAPVALVSGFDAGAGLAAGTGADAGVVAGFGAACEGDGANIRPPIFAEHGANSIIPFSVPWRGLASRGTGAAAGASASTGFCGCEASPAAPLR